MAGQIQLCVICGLLYEHCVLKFFTVGYKIMELPAKTVGYLKKIYNFTRSKGAGNLPKAIKIEIMR